MHTQFDIFWLITICVEVKKLAYVENCQRTSGGDATYVWVYIVQLTHRQLTLMDNCSEEHKSNVQSHVFRVQESNDAFADNVWCKGSPYFGRGYNVTCREEISCTRCMAMTLTDVATAAISATSPAATLTPYGQLGRRVKCQVKAAGTRCRTRTVCIICKTADMR